MEIKLIRSLLNKDFYDRNGRCPDTMFSGDVKKIKRAVDEGMKRYNRDLTPSELESLFYSMHPTLTTAQTKQFDLLFGKLNAEPVMGEDVAQDVMGNMYQRALGEEIANLGFDYVNGEGTSLAPLRSILDKYRDDFMPTTTVEWEDIELDTLINLNIDESKWHFNIPTLHRVVKGVSGGHLIEVGARPETGKTSFHASLIAGPDGFIEQGAQCIVLCNEERYNRVMSRYITAATGMTWKEVEADQQKALSIYLPMKKNLRIKDATNFDIHWVRQVANAYKPDILVLDMGDKFVDPRLMSTMREDQALEHCASEARNIAKEADCAVFYMSQLSAEAQGKTAPDMSMFKGSKTGKAAEGDLVILIGKETQIEGQEENNLRFLNIEKNKLTGYHGQVTCTIDKETARYDV